MPSLNISPGAGDEILSVNGQTLHGLSHNEAISVFKRIRSGGVSLQVVRRPASRARSGWVTQSQSEGPVILSEILNIWLTQHWSDHVTEQQIFIGSQRYFCHWYQFSWLMVVVVVMWSMKFNLNLSEVTTLSIIFQFLYFKVNTIIWRGFRYKSLP